MTPLNKWTEALDDWEPRMLPPHTTLMELTGQLAERVLDRGTIRIFGFRYASQELARFSHKIPGRKVMKIRFDPEDISTIYVINYETGETFKAVCQGRLIREYTHGISLHVHRVIRMHAIKGRENNEEQKLRIKELMDAKIELMKIADSMLSKKSVKGRKGRIARFLEGLEHIYQQNDTQKYDDFGSVDDEIESTLFETSAATEMRRGNTPDIFSQTKRDTPEKLRTDHFQTKSFSADIPEYADTDFDLEVE
ncbi:Mu transposase C-terminal domain-containing protein [Ahrensia sp. 13_GOM-1096m]|uniref:Mu transposase C-terminal domain-containing protein n=1 Tax=Ahrensia sp. 13_GOM-1096m TaxID=1380380 RepID=UPI00047927DB|nr:Mu transposase C-terminal domain-containing protein [Ahrensia sp. 13_GOM-1096m]